MFETQRFCQLVGDRFLALGDRWFFIFLKSRAKLNSFAKNQFLTLPLGLM